MNPLGMMSYVYLEHTAEEMADAIASHGIRLVQLDPRQKGLADGPEPMTAARAGEIRRLFAERGISIPVLSGYINLMAPDPERRERNLAELERVIELCAEFGAAAIATETGSLHPTNQWGRHEDNFTESAWEALVETIDRVRTKAAEHGVTLLLEGYVNNVLHRTEQAVRLARSLGGRGLGFVMDPFNYMREDDLDRQEAALDRMFADIGAMCPIAHAKDVVYTEKGISTPRAGAGVMRWEQFARRLSAHAPNIPLFLEHLKPEEAEACIAFVRSAFERGAETARSEAAGV